jgi:hypothetical protein
MKAIANREDFLDHGLKFKIVKDLSFLPDYVIKNKEKFKGWFADKPKEKGLHTLLLKQRMQLRLLLRHMKRKFISIR